MKDLKERTKIIWGTALYLSKFYLVISDADPPSKQSCCVLKIFTVSVLIL
jgi:hypothetical protein